MAAARPVGLPLSFPALGLPQTSYPCMAPAPKESRTIRLARSPLHQLSPRPARLTTQLAHVTNSCLAGSPRIAEVSPKAMPPQRTRQPLLSAPNGPWFAPACLPSYPAVCSKAPATSSLPDSFYYLSNLGSLHARPVAPAAGLLHL